MYWAKRAAEVRWSTLENCNKLEKCGDIGSGGDQGTVSFLFQFVLAY